MQLNQHNEGSLYIYGQEKSRWSLLYEQEKCRLPFRALFFLFGQEPARGDHPPNRNGIPCVLSVFVCVRAFIYFGSVIDTFNTMSYVNRGFRDERRVICDV